MITGIGIDIVHIKRMERWLADRKLLERFFHPYELEYSLSRGNAAASSLAARFAAKEAFGKALGTGFADIELKDIMINNVNNGQPQINLFDSAQKALEKTGAQRVHVSLSHEKEYALAMILIEKNRG